MRIFDNIIFLSFVVGSWFLRCIGRGCKVIVVGMRFGDLFLNFYMRISESKVKGGGIGTR